MGYDPTLPFSPLGTAPYSPIDLRDHHIRAYIGAPRGVPAQAGAANIDAYPGIRNQLNEGTCTGHALRSVKGTIERRAKRTRSARNRVPEFGPRGMYELGKRLGGYPDEEGAYLRDVVKAAAKYGSPREADWPYQPCRDDKGRPVDIGHPDKAFSRRAKYWKVGAYARVQRLEEIRYTLEAVGPVFMAMTLHDSFWETGPDGMVPMPKASEAEQGGHAMAIIADDEEKRAFLTPNSWGPDWADKGFCWIKWDHFFGVEHEAWAVPDYVAT